MPEQAAIESHEVVQCGAMILSAATTSDIAQPPQTLWARHDDPSCQRPFLLYIRTVSDAETRAKREELSANVEASDAGWCGHALQMSECKVLPDEADPDDEQDINVFVALVRDLETYKWYHEHAEPEAFSHPISIYDASIPHLRETTPHAAYGDSFEAPPRTGTQASEPESMTSDHSSSEGRYSDYMISSSAIFPPYNDHGPPEAGSDNEQGDFGHMSDID